MTIMINKLLWCPIDIPKFPIKDFNLNTTTEWADWKFLKITEKRPSPYDISKISSNISELYPSFISWINLFPYKTIRNIKYNIQTNSVRPHIDFTNPSRDMELYNNNAENEPCGYRVLIAGKRTNSLYIMNNGIKVHTIMPDDTDVYVLGHTSTLHGVEHEEGRVTMFLHFETDTDKHQELLGRSIEKYSKYAIFKK